MCMRRLFRPFWVAVGGPRLSCNCSDNKWDTTCTAQLDIHYSELSLLSVCTRNPMGHTYIAMFICKDMLLKLPEAYGS